MNSKINIGKGIVQKNIPSNTKVKLKYGNRKATKKRISRRLPNGYLSLNQKWEREIFNTDEQCERKVAPFGPMLGHIPERRKRQYKLNPPIGIAKMRLEEHDLLERVKKMRKMGFSGVKRWRRTIDKEKIFRITSSSSGNNNNRPPDKNLQLGGQTDESGKKMIRKGLFSFSSDTDASMITLDCNIYIDTDDVRLAEKYYISILNVLDTLDFQLLREDPPKIGSWSRRFAVRVKEAIKSQEVQVRLNKFEKAIELKNIELVQSQVDKNLAEAAAVLINGFGEEPNFCCLIDRLLIVRKKADGNALMIARNLSERQIKYLYENQFLLKNPIELFKYMSNEIEMEKRLEEKNKWKAAGE